MNIKIQVFTPEEKHRNDVGELLFQLSGKRRIADLESHPDSYFIGAFDDNKLVGFAQIFILHKFAFSFGLLEDVIVDKGYRAQGIGKKLILEAIDHSKRKGVDRINLTSRPERIEARNLYESLGFVKQDTNVFRLEFK